MTEQSHEEENGASQVEHGTLEGYCWGTDNPIYPSLWRDRVLPVRRSTAVSIYAQSTKYRGCEWTRELCVANRGRSESRGASPNCDPIAVVYYHHTRAMMMPHVRRARAENHRENSYNMSHRGGTWDVIYETWS